MEARQESNLTAEKRRWAQKIIAIVEAPGPCHHQVAEVEHELDAYAALVCAGKDEQLHALSAKLTAAEANIDAWHAGHAEQLEIRATLEREVRELTVKCAEAQAEIARLREQARTMRAYARIWLENNESA